MTDTLSFSPRLFPASPVRSNLPSSFLVPARRSLRPAPLPARSTLPRVPAEDCVSQGLLLGLVAITLPAVAYSLLQAWNLANGDVLARAVHAFVR